MQPNDAYEFQYVGGKDNIYLFSTSKGSFYEIKFKPSGYIFESSFPFSEFVYEFTIALLDGPTRFGDTKIAVTVSDIIYDFFSSKEKVLVYLCDDSDGRASVRNRKFSQWFQWYDRGGFVKSDFMFGSRQEPYYATVIMSLENPYLEEITVLFQKVIGVYDKP